METLQTAEHVSEGNKSSSLLYKQIQSLLCRQEGTAALPQQQGSPGPHAASNTQEPVEEKAVYSLEVENAGCNRYRPNDPKSSSTERRETVP